jgi:transposase InsO family protein
VTQWQVVGCASKISEAYLIPVLEAMLHQFPFLILGFHADNGSEFINHTVAKLLEKLPIERSNPRSRSYEPGSRRGCGYGTLWGSPPWEGSSDR